LLHLVSWLIWLDYLPEFIDEALQIQAAGVLAEEARSADDGLQLLRPTFLSQVYRCGLEL
jgi:hypothetical protein